jgi:hypothetical protein
MSVFVTLLFPYSRSEAAFTLNFLPKGSGTFTNAATTFSQSGGDNGTDPNTGQSRWLWGGAAGLERPEIVSDAATGKYYYHMIVGDLATGFIQESYIEMGTFGGYGNNVETTGLPGGLSAASASGGTGTYIPKTVDANSATFGNGSDPMDMNKDAKAQNVVSGNGTGNPMRALIRTLVNDGQMMSEFLKDDFDSKPQITQLVVAPDIQVVFDLDMRGISYSDNTKTAPIISTMQLFGEGAPHDSAVWDYATETTNKHVDGGQFIYAVPHPENPSDSGANGTYTYLHGGFDQTAQDWKTYMNPSYQEANPWTFESSKVPQ